jgi:outer membrane translocation and assembly module TamA
LGVDRSERIAGYQQALIVDLRDNQIEPKLGAYGELRTTEGTPLAGGQTSYFGLVSDARGYVPLLAGVVLAGHARYGAVWGDVPVTERFFAGGAVSQRGFGERRLSPSVPVDPMQRTMVTTLPYGGAGLIDTSLEARVPITKIRTMPLGMVTFLDGGDVTDAATGLDPMHLHWAVGAGVRLLTVVGPVRLDVGYRLNRTGPTEPDPGSRWAYHLTIGEAF